jgi:hypothetical protein
LLCLLFDPEEGGDIFLRNVGWLSTGYTALYPRRWNSSKRTLFIPYRIKTVPKKPVKKVLGPFVLCLIMCKIL